MVEVIGQGLAYPYRFAWRNNPRRAEWYGRDCRVIARGKMGSVLIEFADGSREIVSSRSIRRRRPG